MIGQEASVAKRMGVVKVARARKLLEEMKGYRKGACETTHPLIPRWDIRRLASGFRVVCHLKES